MSSDSTLYMRSRVAQPRSSSSPEGCSAVEYTSCAAHTNLLVDGEGQPESRNLYGRTSCSSMIRRIVWSS